jgi:hypothetical protein
MTPTIYREPPVGLKFYYTDIEEYAQAHGYRVTQAGEHPGGVSDVVVLSKDGGNGPNLLVFVWTDGWAPRGNTNYRRVH